MDATSLLVSKPILQKRDALPIMAEDGVVMTDLSLRPIAIDRGATTILTDINRAKGAAEAASALPVEITTALRDSNFHQLSDFRMRLRGERQSYDCRAYLLESRLRTEAQSTLTFHFRRITSPGEAIRKLSAECNLTRREEEVLTGISIGLTSKELGERLNISPNTVKAFLRLIMLKMGVTTRAAIVGKLLEYGSADTQ